MTDITALPGTLTVEACLDAIYDDLVELAAAVDGIVVSSMAWTYSHKTSDYTVVTGTDTYGAKIFTNRSATGTVNFTMPAGATNMRVTFQVAAAQILKFTVQAGETIRYKGEQTASGGYLQSNNTGDTLTVEVNGTEWVVTNLIGDWSHASGNFSDQYRTFYLDASAFVPCTTNGCAALATNEYGTNDIDYLAFDGATEERAQAKFKMPEDWDLSTVKYKVDWSSATGSSSADTVEWESKAGALSDSDAIDAALGTSQVISDAVLANNGTDWQTTDASPALTIGGSPALSDTIVWELSRNVSGTDDMTEDAWLFGMWVQYKSNKSPAAW